MSFFKKRKIALALGGGAARGLANIGVIKVFQREGIPIDLVVGSSIGAMLAAGYCLGIPTYRIEKTALECTTSKLTDVSVSRKGFLKGKKLEKLICSFIEGRTFSDAKIPLAVTTTDIETGEEIVYTKGNLEKILVASSSWPGIFPAVEIDGRKLVDGGIRNSIPVKNALDLGATFTIAVHIGFCVKTTKLDNPFQLFIQSIQILGEELDRYQTMRADVIIKPALVDLDQFAFDRGAEAISDGERAAEKALPEIKKKLGLKGKDPWK
ncbi:MAG: patatin-like phospholipase family protein [Candidatus Omnitrophica bacterium]|nr:patatin-like phospholipase family protein [Candidatus Omnitrophota bacterium]